MINNEMINKAIENVVYILGAIISVGFILEVIFVVLFLGGVTWIIVDFLLEKRKIRREEKGNE